MCYFIIVTTSSGIYWTQIICFLPNDIQWVWPTKMAVLCTLAYWITSHLLVAEVGLSMDFYNSSTCVDFVNPVASVVGDNP